MATRERRPVDNESYAGFVLRSIDAMTRRVGTGDIEGIRDLARIEQRAHDARVAAITRLHDEGYSWGEIARRTGTTRQAVQQLASRAAQLGAA